MEKTKVPRGPSIDHLHPVLISGMAACLREIFVDGAYADKALERTFKKNRKWGSRDRRFMAETVYDMVRWWSLLAKYDGGPFSLKTEVEYVKRWFTYEAWHHKKDLTDFVKNHLVKDLQIPDGYFQTLRQRINEMSLEPWEKVAFPQWLYEKIVADYPSDGADLMAALNRPASVWLRTNTLKTTPENLLKALEAEGIEAAPSPEIAGALVLKERKNVFITKAFKDGFFEVQDAASQRVAPLVEALPGERIADVCAGAGGKTLHLAALMGNKGSLLAADTSARKLDELKVRARRAGVSNLRIQLFENSKDIKRHAEKFDGVLIDAPCSGSGVIRRNSDSKWKLTPEELVRLKEIQKTVLDDYARLVRPGGRLVYATCSLLHEEGPQQIDAFLTRNTDFVPDGDALWTRPDRDSQDGFFAQRLRRKKP